MLEIGAQLDPVGDEHDHEPFVFVEHAVNSAAAPATAKIVVVRFIIDHQ